MSKQSLQLKDFEKAAADLGCEVAAIQAVHKVESAGSSFISDGQPVILFEPHVFGRLTKGKYNATHPKISSPSWNKALYSTGKTLDIRVTKEHAKLQEAASLDRDAALQSCSWGAFQVMGFNWKMLGYPNLQAFINAAYRDEAAHLDMFVRYIKAAGLETALRTKNWARFARGYNGASYAKNRYDILMKQHYDRFKAAEKSNKNGVILD